MQRLQFCQSWCKCALASSKLASILVLVHILCRLCQEMREHDAPSHSHPSPVADYQKHLDECGRRKTLKPDSYFSDEDASD